MQHHAARSRYLLISIKQPGSPHTKLILLLKRLRIFQLNDLNKNRILSAVETELAAKGFSKAESNPDVMIDVKLKGEQKQTATANTSGGYGYGYRYGWGEVLHDNN